MYASSPRICTEVTNVEFRRRLEPALTIGGPDPSNGTRTIMTISLEVAEESPRRIENYRTSPETARPNRGRRICERAFGTAHIEAIWAGCYPSCGERRIDALACAREGSGVDQTERNALPPRPERRGLRA
jgi:hypothetical protein